jgi:nitrate/nitrite-specific signal transduction histidine kinase
MRERAIQLGGSFSIQARSEGGTQVQAQLPLPRAMEAAEDTQEAKQEAKSYA